LKVWLKADAITGLHDGDAVGTWSDQSGNGFDATQATAGNKPTYKTSILAGKPVVRFDGVGDELDFSGSALGIFNNVGGGTIIIVASDTNNAVGDTTHPFVRWSTNTTTNRIGIVSKNTGTSQFGALGRRLDASSSAISSGTFATGFHILIARADWTNNLLTLYIDGVAQTAVTFSSGGGNTSATNSNIAFIGGTASGFFANDIAEMFVFQRALTTDELAQITNSLIRKYALPITPLLSVSTGLKVYLKADQITANDVTPGRMRLGKSQ
jgi:hypothetical protein